MEFIKQSENFTFTETAEFYESKGSVNLEGSGLMHINFTINKVDGTYVGDCQYSNYSDNNTINFNVNCHEEFRKEITEYAESIIDGVIEHFKSID